MGRSSIAELSVKISASADAFNSIVNGAEKRVTGFASKVSAVPKNIVSGFAGMGRTITNPVDDFMKTADGLLGFLPGGKLISASWGLADGLSGIEESGKRGIDSMRALRREAQRFDVSPKFLRAFQLSGGPDAELAGKVIDKTMDALGSLKAGDVATEKALAPFVDIAKLKEARPEEAIYQIADAYKALGDQTQRLYFLGNVVGNKLADDAHYFFAGGRAGIGGNLGTVNRLGLYDEEAAKASDVNAQLQRKIKLIKEGIDVKNSVYSNAATILEGQYMEGKIGFFSWLDQRAGVLKESWLGRASNVSGLSASIVSSAAGPAPDTLSHPSRNGAMLGSTLANFKKTDDARRAIIDMTKSLKDQADTFGMTTEEALAYRAAQAGVESSLVSGMGAQAMYNQGLRDAREVTERAKSVQEDLQSPMEKVNAQFSKLAELGNLLTPEQHMIQQGKIMSEAFGLENLLRRPTGVGAASLALQGTQEAFAAIERTRNNGVRSPSEISQDEIRDAVKTQVDLDREKRDLLKKIANEKAKIFQIPN